MSLLKKTIIASAAVLLVACAGLLFFYRHQIVHSFANAKGQRMIANHIATASDLTGRLTIPAEYFDQIKAFPEWSAVPQGFEMFRNVPFQIDGVMCLWGANNAKAGLVLPEEQLGAGPTGKFGTLYIYDATFYSSPPETPVYEVVFRYDDGSSVTNQILYGNDVFDWFSGGKTPASPRSKVAWQGSYNNGGRVQPLSFYITALENPHPEIPVTSVDLYSSKNGSAACIGAMTAGPSGLMR